jgi:glucuronate isomerase
MQDSLARELADQMAAWPIFDSHSHIDPHQPAARHLDEILGYHYYTELCHSAGMPALLVAPELPPDERVHNLATWLDRIDNTVQYSWLIEISETFHGFKPSTLDSSNVAELAARADHAAEGETWDLQVWYRTNLEAVFLTNDFDDPLVGWDTSRYVPCLRTDDLVLKLNHPRTIERLRTATSIDVTDAKTLRLAIANRFEHFRNQGARACAISLPPDFRPRRSTPIASGKSVHRAIHGLDLRADEHEEVRTFVFWTIAELCHEFKLPFDLMIGPIRNVYPAGVSGGRDLFDRRVSLADYAELFNHFAGVNFPVSVLSPDAGPELVAYSWIFPNVFPHGHWWYSNVPAFIKSDLRARLQAVPKTKILGYYSDAYKLEFVLPKFNTFRNALASVLADDFVREQGWSIERAIELAHDVLLKNPRRIFARPEDRDDR